VMVLETRFEQGDGENQFRPYFSWMLIEMEGCVLGSSGRAFGP
jgi:hypothetical protein